MNDMCIYIYIYMIWRHFMIDVSATMDHQPRTLPLPHPAKEPKPKLKSLRGRKPKHLEYRYMRQHASSSATSYPLPPHRTQETHCVLTLPEQVRKDQPHLRERLSWLLTTLMKHPMATPFIAPVDVSAVPTYAHVISHPMDLSTIERKLHQDAYGYEKEAVVLHDDALSSSSSSYATSDSFLRDMERMFDNCFLFNTKQAKVYR
jgi:hypothetical protein